MAPIRNFGHRVTRIFRRKKHRPLGVNPRPTVQTQNPSRREPKLLNNIPANDSRELTKNTPVDNAEFQRCTSYSLKHKNYSPSQAEAPVEPPNPSEEHKTTPTDKTYMEDKPKDINQLYREMEEVVARQVRETMELADAKRKALATGTLVTTHKQITVSVENASRSTPAEVPETSEDLNTLNNITGQFTDKLNGSKDANQNSELDGEDVTGDERQKELKGFEEPEMSNWVEFKENVSEIGSQPINAEVKDDIESLPYSPHLDMALGALNLAQNATQNINYGPFDSTHSSRTESFEKAPSFDEQKPQIGFEHFAAFPRNSSLDQSTQEGNDREANKLDLAHGALNLAEQAVRNSDGNSQEPDKITLVEDTAQADFDNTRRIAQDALALAQNAIRNNAIEDTHSLPQNINNTNPFETIVVDTDLKQYAENALTLAENAIKNFSGKNPFELSDDEADINTQNTFDVFRTPTNPFDVIDDAGSDTRQGSVTIVQNTSKKYGDNPFQLEDENADFMRQIGADALSIAQTAAWNVEAENRQLGENAEDIDNAFNSLIDSAELDKPVVQIGFDQLKETYDKQKEEINDNILNVGNDSRN